MESASFMSTIQCPPLPTDTAQAALLVFGREHPYLRLGLSLESILKELEIPVVHTNGGGFLFNRLYPYALLTAFQYWENLTDRQMSQATRTRLDMKYALHFPLNFPGIEASALCEFRRQALADHQAMEILGEIIRHLTSQVNLDKPLPDPWRMMAEICLPSRAESIQEFMGIAIEAIAVRNPLWLKTHTLPHWYRRYHIRSGAQKIPHDPKEIGLLIESVGNDGRLLLKMLDDSKATALMKLPEIQSLRYEWKRQFFDQDDRLKFRASHCLMCSSDRM